jgi:protease IV
MAEENKRSGWFWLLVGGGIFAAFLVVASVVIYFAFRTFSGDSTSLTSLGSGGNIGVIDVDGVIMNAELLNTQLRKFEQDSSIKAIILHIDSPGGGAAASQEVYDEVRRIRDGKKKPIITSIESEGASGAYYIASGTEKIYANRASIVGSIGVIMEYMNYGELLKWAKLKQEVLKAGDLKDAGSPDRDLTPVERAYLQGLVDNMHTQFINDVAAGRGLPVDQVRAIASGRVWTGEQALPMHLIDKTGGFREALMDTAKQVGISGEPNVVKPAVKKRGLVDLLGSDADDLSKLWPSPGKLLEKNTGFYFLWKD